MRIVSWNCNGALRRKTHLLNALSADLVVVQECEDPAKYGGIYENWAGNYLWVGDLHYKGLGIFSRTGLKIEPLVWPGSEFRLFLPARIDNKFNIIGVWTQNTKPTSSGYIGQFWRYLHVNRTQIGSSCILCGDFNSNAIWDKDRQFGNHSQCVDELSKLGINSLYHVARQEPHGGETIPTFHQYRNKEKPFHIDYVFATREFSERSGFEIQIGSIEDWLCFSDHLPLILDLQI